MSQKEKKRKRLKAILKERKSLHKSHSYEWEKLPRGKRAVKNKWVEL